MRRIALPALLLLTSCAMLPRPGKPAMSDVQFRMREFQLANGLRVVVEEDHSAPLVGVFTVVGVGSANDPEGKEGLAHLLEHLAFRARPGNGQTAWNRLEKAGVGFLNASTSFDETIYMEVAAKSALPQLLQLEMARLIDPLDGVEQKVFEVEREVVRNELRQRGENSVGPAFNYLQEVAFPATHPYSRPVGGSHESLSSIGIDDARRFARQNYRFDNMTMLIIGDVELETFDQTLKAALPSPVFEPRAVVGFPSRLAPNPSEPPDSPPVQLTEKQSTVASPELYVVWTLPRAFDAETVLLDFVNNAANAELGRAFFSDPDIASVQVFPIPGAQASMLVARATLRRGDDVQRSLGHVLDQLVHLWTMTGEEDEVSAEVQVMATDRAFGRMQNAALVGMTAEAEDLLSRGPQRVSTTHFTGDPLTYSRRLKALGGVTPSQVSAYAEKYLRRDRARALVLRPFTEGDKRALVGPAGLAPADTATTFEAVPASEVLKLGKGQVERAKLETVVSAKRDFIDATLANGLRVVVQKRRDGLPIASLALSVPVGTGAVEPLGAALLAGQLARPVNHLYGSGADFGISWGADVSDERVLFQAQGADGNVTNMIAQLSDRVGAQRVEGASLAFFKSQILPQQEANEKLAAVRAAREVNAALYGEHPLGRTATSADEEKLSAGDVERWFDRALSPRGAVLVISGNIDTEAAFAEAQRSLSGWRAPSSPFAPVPKFTWASTPRKVLVTHQPSATQARVRLSCVVPSGELKQLLAQQALSHLVSTTLFEKIRGELGASYGFGGGVVPRAGGVWELNWAGSVEQARLGDALVALETVLGGLEQTFASSALDRARWQVARDLTLTDASSMGTVQFLSEEVLAGRPAERALATRFETLATVGAPDLEAAWQQCRQHFVLGFTGDEPKVREALEGAGL